MNGPAGSTAAPAPAQWLLGPPGFPVPDDLLLHIFGHHLDATERRLACLVCRRWRQLVDHPSLLSILDVTFEGDSWAQRLLHFATWLPQRAMHVLQLSVRAVPLADGPPPSPSEEEGACAFEASVGLLAACGAAHQLTSLSLQLGCEFQQDRWLPALRTLRSLSIDTFHEAALGASLAPLTALKALELAGMPTELEAGFRLPPSLTALHIRYLQAELQLEQLRALTQLRSLYLSLMTLASNAYAGLTAVSCSLHSLALVSSLALPACLPQLSGLEALCIIDPGRVLARSEGEPVAILTAALSQLTALTRLALVTSAIGTTDAADDQPPDPSPMIPAALPLLAGCSRLRSLLLVDDAPAGLQLPAGLSGLRQLAAPLQMLASSLPALAGCTALQLLGLLSCDAFLRVAEPSELFSVLFWALHLPAMDKLLMVASDELAEDARAALFATVLYLRERGTRPPNRVSVMVAPNALDCPEIGEIPGLP